MNAGTFELLTFGVMIIVAGALILVTLVRELAPSQRRKWLLGIALGSGIITFSLKIALVAVFSSFPEELLALLPEKDYSTESAYGDHNWRPGDSAVSRHASLQWQPLPGSAPYPADNPPTPEKIALGKRLFFDKRLSEDGSLSCASCHVLSEQKGGADGRTTSVGIHRQQGDRNAPTVLNAAFQRVLFWDGRAASLEEQAKGPLVNPLEMGMPSLKAVVDRVEAIPEYRLAFERIFADTAAVTIDNIAKAIAAYERTLITPNTPYDRFVRGDEDALSAQQIRGMSLFETLGCISCHAGPNFSGASLLTDIGALRLFPAFRDAAVEAEYRLLNDLGAADASTGAEQGIWRIPSLRNVSRTAPYFHNGSVESLEEAVRIMARVQLDRRLSNVPADDRVVRWSARGRSLIATDHNALSDDEVGDLVAFLESLAGDVPQ